MSNNSDVKEFINIYIENIKPELIELSKKIHENPELAYEEYKASNWLKEFIEKKGYDVEKPIGNLETAFKSNITQGNNNYKYAILAEYDALPKLGHACGHNIISTSAVGAFLALGKAMEMFKISGDISIIGTPAEEGGGGKVELIKAGIFKDINASIMMHPTSGVSRIAGRCLAAHAFKVRYIGVPSHAASSPHRGVNALDAANIFFHSVACLRQQVTSDVRMHGVFTGEMETGATIPAISEIEYKIRAMEDSTLQDLRIKVLNCIQAGALATGCKVEIEEKPGYKARIFDKYIGNLCRENLENLGEEIIEGFPDDFGSTDFGDVSQIMPTCNPYISLKPTRISNHTPEFRELAGSSPGEKALILAAKSMAHVIIDLLLNKSLENQIFDK
ncbi:M20 family metallopeptidase [Clostridium sp. CF012]|uniref:M20 family metallopeptidase n=1 Tax=Clostridium sp. CF012 TaxID=2843319 RepID=UPI001C0D45DF|nr:M20 family metallopeptidase [Clostridium sp. CF012]MBU3143266.1 M20 family metallopeptidase [Clostridium sp. CF012]